VKRKIDKSLKRVKDARNIVDSMNCLIFNKKRKEIEKRETLII